MHALYKIFIKNVALYKIYQKCLCHLQDFSTTTRDSLRDMLGEMKLATRECLSKCIYSLLDNLRRYPQDKQSIWKYVDTQKLLPFDQSISHYDVFT